LLKLFFTKKGKYQLLNHFLVVHITYILIKYNTFFFVDIIILFITYIYIQPFLSKIRNKESYIISNFFIFLIDIRFIPSKKKYIRLMDSSKYYEEQILVYGGLYFILHCRCV